MITMPNNLRANKMELIKDKLKAYDNSSKSQTCPTILTPKAQYLKLLKEYTP